MRHCHAPGAVPRCPSITRSARGPGCRPSHRNVLGRTFTPRAWNRGCGSVAGIWNGRGERIATFPVDGRMGRGDICGDDRTEVVDYVMGDHAYVYANGPCDLSAKVTGRPLPQAKKLYDYTRYTAEEIPLELSRGRAATASSTLPGHSPGRYVRVTAASQTSPMEFAGVTVLGTR